MNLLRFTIGRALLPAQLLFAGLLSGGYAGPLAADDAAVLEVLDDQGKRLLAIPMPRDAGWCLEWNHSVKGFAVLDCYRHHDGRMELQRSHLPDFAAGLDHIPGRGRQVSDGEDGYWIEDIDEPVPGNAYRLRVGSMSVDHRLVIDSSRISLSALAADRRVTIRLVFPSLSPIDDNPAR